MEPICLILSDFFDSDISDCEFYGIEKYTGLKCENANFRNSHFFDKELVAYLRNNGAINVNDPE